MQTGHLAWSVWRPAALVGGAVGLVLMFADPDLWGHVRFGLDILETGTVRQEVDPYSFTQDHPFTYHEWLGGVLMAAAYLAGGPPGLMVYKGLLAAAIFLAAWLAVRQQAFAWRWGAMALATWGTLPLTLTLRPQLWTGIGVFLVCRVLTARSPRALLALPPLFAVWANLHGGWIVGGGIVLVWTIASFLAQVRQPAGQPGPAAPELGYRALLAAGAASFAATLLNPYGIELWTFLLETVRLGRDRITEWQPPWTLRGPSMVALMATAAAIAASIGRHGRPGPQTLAVLVALGLAAARVSRLAPLFALASVALLSRHWHTTREAPTGRQRVRLLLDAGAVATVVAAGVWSDAIDPCITNRHSTAPDTIAAESLRGVRGRLVTSFNWGEYALWHFGPALKVSIDGRRESLYSERTINEQLAIADGDPAGFAVLARLNPDYVWLPASSRATADWLRANGYREDVTTDRSFIAVRSDLPPLRPWHGDSSGCFPGP